MIRAGVVGYRGHARRIIDRLELIHDVELTHIYHPTKQLEDPRGTNDFDDMRDCDAVFILSPTETHAGYLDIVRETFVDSYVFCEKPPFSTREELDRFAEPDGKTFFDFNFRYSAVARMLKSSMFREHVGDVIHVNVYASHGLAFKDGYRDSWRADIDAHPIGPVETVGCHWLDLLNYTFGDGSVTSNVRNVSGVGTAPDTGHIVSTHGSGVTSSIFVSYAAPMCFKFSVVGTNGIMQYEDADCTIRSPRDTYFKGKFATPPIWYRQHFYFEGMYEDSLDTSLATFLEVCRAGDEFNPDDYGASIRTNRLLLDMRAVQDPR